MHFSQTSRGAARCGSPITLGRHLLVLVFAVALALSAPGCGPDLAAGPSELTEDPRAIFDSPFAGVNFIEARHGRLLLGNVETSELALVDDTGETRWSMVFDGERLMSLRLAPDGESVFVSLSRESDGTSRALLVDESGHTQWERSTSVPTAFYDALLSPEGAGAVLFARSTGAEGHGLPLFEILDPVGTVTTSSEPTMAAIVDVSSSGDLSRLTVITSVADPTGEQAPTSRTTWFEDGRVIRSEETSGFALAAVSSDGARTLETDAETSLAVAEWGKDERLAEFSSQHATKALFSEDGGRLLLCSLKSIERSTGVSYETAVDIRDVRGRSLHGATHTTVSAGAQVQFSPTLRAVAVLPWSAADRGVLWEEQDETWTSKLLPSGTSAGCFDEGGRMYLTNVDGKIRAY